MTKILIGFTPAMLGQMDAIAKAEHRTRSDLVREAMRRYIGNFRHPQLPSAAVEQPSPELSAPLAVQFDPELISA